MERAPAAWTHSTGTSLPIAPAKADPGAEASVRQLYGQLPLIFERNQGQSDSRVDVAVSKRDHRTGGVGLPARRDDSWP